MMTARPVRAAGVGAEVSDGGSVEGECFEVGSGDVVAGVVGDSVDEGHGCLWTAISARLRNSRTLYS
jgi:hypothetical protein